jgi:hypothetical protein
LSRSPFYQLNRCIWGERAIAISLLKDRFSPRCQCRPLAFITNEQRRKNNSEKRLGFDDFSVLLLTIFSIKLLLPSPTRDMGYLHPQTEFHHAAHATPSRHHIQSGDTKRTVCFCPESIFYSDL